jgi:hypothetical protein
MPVDEPSFAETRSHADAQAVHEHARSAAQSIILVNGGAATAALAFAGSYPAIGAASTSLLASGFAAYVIGVAIGAYNMRKLTGATYFYMRAWEDQARGRPEEEIRASFERAHDLKAGGDLHFSLGFLCFLLGSLLVGLAIFSLPIPAGAVTPPSAPPLPGAPGA